MQRTPHKNFPNIDSTTITYFLFLCHIMTNAVIFRQIVHTLSARLAVFRYCSLLGFIPSFSLNQRMTKNAEIVIMRALEVGKELVEEW
jgi:positive regulator of sigma E activity